MPNRRFPLSKFPELLKNPPPNVDIMLYDKNKKGPIHHPIDKVMTKSKMDRLEEMIANLAKQMNARFDRLTNDVISLKQDVKGINARLDYIVEANNLKDIK